MKHQSHATLTALLFLFLLLVTESPRYLQDKSTSTLQQQIATQVLRFHIRANSDTVADQQKKLRIKQSLLEWLTPILSENTSKSETIQCIRKNLPDIRKEATRMAAPEPVITEIGFQDFNLLSWMVLLFLCLHHTTPCPKCRHCFDGLETLSCSAPCRCFPRGRII